MPLLEMRHLPKAKSQKSRLHWLWCTLFGPLYLAHKGIWRHALIETALTPVTLGLAWLVYPFFARSLLRAQLVKQGWEDISFYR